MTYPSLRPHIRWFDAKLHWRSQAFSLVEILIVIVVIGILSGMAMSYFGGASEQSSLVVARQHQAQLQGALDAWISGTSSGTGGLATAKAAYSTDSAAMLTAVAPYLRDPEIFSVADGSISSAALNKIGKTLQFSSWASNSYPKVIMQ